MHLRRAIGLVTVLSMFHLYLVGSDVVCVTHDAGGAETATAVEESTPHHTGDFASAGQESDAPVPCDTPTRLDCCVAMASCSSVMSSVTRTGVTQAIALESDVVRLAINTPTSRNTAPEPPPPKA